MELKQATSKDAVKTSFAFNQTRMELKRYTQDQIDYENELLIRPEWN